ncbi:BTAD domain-containing putative transcriptional regulator [Streptomyces sp. NPDC046712]|uniref:BTAD domain-containing putative transcriptional regulator n=1 Tax=Streptomyces sp. NPDC046712 TaxID=3154802 RepID=UPI0033D1CFCA
MWTGSGYRLTGARIDDLCERRELLRGAITAREAGDLRQAGELAGEAESLWRGEYAEGLTGPYLEAERRWAEKRTLVLEARLEGGIAQGRYDECVHELVRLEAAHRRSRGWGPGSAPVFAPAPGGAGGDTCPSQDPPKTPSRGTAGRRPGPGGRLPR